MNEIQQKFYAQIRLHKLVILSSAFIEEFEDPRIIHTEESLELLNEMRKSNEILLKHLDQYYDNEFVKKTTFYVEVQNAFNYSFKKHFQRFFKIDIDKYLGFKL